MTPCSISLLSLRHKQNRNTNKAELVPMIPKLVHVLIVYNLRCNLPPTHSFVSNYYKQHRSYKHTVTTLKGKSRENLKIANNHLLVRCNELAAPAAILFAVHVLGNSLSPCQLDGCAEIRPQNLQLIFVHEHRASTRLRPAILVLQCTRTRACVVLDWRRLRLLVFQKGFVSRNHASFSAFVIQLHKWQSGFEISSLFFFVLRTPQKKCNDRAGRLSLVTEC